MNSILFIVPSDYKIIGGLRLPIEQYLIAMKENYKVRIEELSYHPTLEECKRLMDKYIDDKLVDIIVIYGLNQTYSISKYISANIEKKYRIISMMMDSGYLYASSIDEFTSYNIKEFKDKIKIKAKKILYKYKEKQCLKYCTDIVYVSRVDFTFVKKKYHDIQAKLWLIPNGVSINTFINDVTRDTNRFYLGFLSSYTPAVIVENLKPIVEELLPALIEKGLEIELVVAGMGMEEELNKYLAQFSYVSYIGAVDAISDFYEQIDVVIPLTKKRNGILNKVLEAWSFGKCVIAYDYNFYAFEKAIVGKHYLAGADIGEIQQILHDVIIRKIDISEIGCNAFRLVNDYYSWENVKKKVMEMLKG